MKRMLSAVGAFLLLFSMLTFAFKIQLVRGSETIYIRSDGSVDPITAPIINLDNKLYNFTDNINGSIVVQRSNIVVDGANYLLEAHPIQYSSGINVTRGYNITIQNIHIRGCIFGVYLYNSINISICTNNFTGNLHGISLQSSSNNTIQKNTLTNNRYGIWFNGTSHNFVTENNITANSKDGVMIDLQDIGGHTFVENYFRNNSMGVYVGSSYNKFYHNKFVENEYQVGIPAMVEWNIWDNGYPSGGNYWSDYKGSDYFSGSFQNETSSDGIGDTPYRIFGDNQDNYPFYRGYSPPMPIKANETLAEWHCPVNSELNFTYDIESTAKVRLILEYSGLGVNYDIYTDWEGKHPTKNQYDCAPLNTSTEICSNDHLSQGTYYFMIHNNGTTEGKFNITFACSYIPTVYNLNTGLTYTTIQGAIDASETLKGHTIFAERKIYYEHVTMDKEILLVGESRDSTIIDANGTGYALTMNYGRVSGFTIRNGEYGVNFQGAYCTVEGNSIVSNLKHGIEIYSYFNVNITNNFIAYNGYDGIFAYSSLYHEKHNIEGNTITANGWGGIALWASKCNIVGNNITGNDNVGIELWHDAFQTTVHSNWIVGVDVMSNDNLFYNNYFYGDLWFGSEASATFNIDRTFCESGNIVGGPYLGGNYWPDYSGEDKDLDGIGDTNYGSGIIRDKFPLLRRNSIYILTDGNVFPSSAPIETLDNMTYTLTQNINNSVLISRNHITFNGNGHTIQGFGDKEGVGLATYNSAIRNMTVRGFGEGIKLYRSSYNTLIGNSITNNDFGIVFYDSSSNNTIHKNTIASNYYGILFRNSSNYNTINENIIMNSSTAITWPLELPITILFSHSNIFYHNDFIDNSNPIIVYTNNSWDDSYSSGGNYWSDYEERYPYASELDNSRIWDTPYIIDEDNKDNFPLVNPKSSTCPDPTLVSINYPDSIELGEWVTVTIEARNDGNEADEMYITASLPENPPIENIEILSHDLQNAYVLPVGSEVFGCYGKVYPVTLDYPLVEGFKENWERGESKTIQFEVRPQEAGIFQFCVKSTAQINGIWRNDPTSGTKDQQHEYVYICEIDVKPDHIDLPVPYEAQGHAQWCWAASATMVLRYYGKSIHVWDVGRLQQAVFTISDLENVVHKMYPGEFVTRKGSYPTVTNKIRSDIEGNLTLGYPIVLRVFDFAIRSHMVVITGYNSTGFFINDPSGVLVKFLFDDSKVDYPFVHEYVTWEALHPLIQTLPLFNDVFLVIEGDPLICRSTLFLYNGEDGVWTEHKSENKGVCIDYGESYCHLSPYWRSYWNSGWHPLIWDSKDTLNCNFTIFNHQNQTRIFDFKLQIIGNDDFVYYKKEISGINVASFDSNSIVVLDIQLEDFLVEDKYYSICAAISAFGSSEIMDSIILKPMYYCSSAISFITECPVRILVTDPDGLRTGYDPMLNRTINEIPNALYYYGNGSEPEIVSIPNQKSGNYSVTVYGVESGIYNYTCTTINETGFLSMEQHYINIPIEQDESQTYIIPEFPSLLILPLSIVATSLAVIFYRRKQTH